MVIAWIVGIAETISGTWISFSKQSQNTAAQSTHTGTVEKMGKNR